ncbi:hypothetical protein [Microbacterium sp.]|uniref:hypothetical protein n=1 Tax=Microbacterium sp. TaxID=51671 RepID=UPI0039E505AA
MTSETYSSDAALLRALRHTWERVDPMPADLVDRMVAAVATADLTREYALLTLVETDALSAVRGDADMLTLQFSDGRTTVLIHATAESGGQRRIDGWIDGNATRVELIPDAGTAPTAVTAVTAVTDGRFAFDAVAPGVSRLRIVLAAAPEPDGATDLMTPRFEV